MKQDSIHHNSRSIHCSVIVCTLNRAASLSRTVTAISRQETGYNAEIIVVDNGSSDDTKIKVKELQAKSAIPIKYILEPEQGLSFARNTGISHARGEIVVFTDDDAMPEKGWLQTIISAFHRHKLAAAGGDALPIWPAGAAPGWLHRALWSYLGLTSFHDKDITPLKYPHYPYGVNMAFRKDVLESQGGFSTALGRKGTSLLSGEETELCRRIEQSGHLIHYIPEAAVQHVINPDRLNHGWFRHRSYLQGQSKAALELNNTTLPGICLLLLKRLAIFSLSVACLFFSALSLKPALLFVNECKIRMSWGYITYFWTQKS